ncbi:hypothetical protein KHA80_23140 [Anaerobacillus sp. HL2]|nr:hypothetical protein KHA80_23140 [Anaerobacillus sp. HL2]
MKGSSAAMGYEPMKELNIILKTYLTLFVINNYLLKQILLTFFLSVLII